MSDAQGAFRAWGSCTVPSPPLKRLWQLGRTRAAAAGGLRKVNSSRPAGKEHQNSKYTKAATVCCPPTAPASMALGWTQHSSRSKVATGVDGETSRSPLVLVLKQAGGLLTLGGWRGGNSRFFFPPFSCSLALSNPGVTDTYILREVTSLSKKKELGSQEGEEKPTASQRHKPCRRTY